VKDEIIVFVDMVAVVVGQEDDELDKLVVAIMMGRSVSAYAVYNGTVRASLW
jgi:hypothetical protein